jgi:hypothetical protein
MGKRAVFGHARPGAKQNRQAVEKFRWPAQHMILAVSKAELPVQC